MSRWVYHSEADFEASHALTRYLGEPEEAHLHRWKVAIAVGTDGLNDEFYGLDFHAVHQALAEVVAPLDHSDFNEHDEISDPSPTAERVALFFAEKLRATIEAIGGSLLSISVWEGPGNQVDLILATEED